jgi:hypothetical protein
MSKNATERLWPSDVYTRESSEIAVPQHCTLLGFTEDTAARKGLHVAALEPLTKLLVRTRNTNYNITIVDPAEWKVVVRGGRFFPTETIAYLCGSGYGGTLIKVAWVGVGLCCELSSNGMRIVTSPVQDFRIMEDAVLGPF